MDWFSKIEWYRADLSRPLYGSKVLIWTTDAPGGTSCNVYPARYREGEFFETCCKKIDAENVDYWALPTWVEREEERTKAVANELNITITATGDANSPDVEIQKRRLREKLKEKQARQLENCQFDNPIERLSNLFPGNFVDGWDSIINEPYG